MSTNTSIKPKRIEEHVEPITIAGLSGDYLFSEPMNPSDQWQQLGPHLGRIPGQKENVAYGVCFDLDDGKGIEYLCGVEVTGDTVASDLPNNFELRQLPSFTYVVFDHKGHVSEIRQTCDVIWKEWLPGSDYDKPEEADFFFERYGENYDAQAGKGDIEIWIPVDA
ncbi:AraC family transcriptional regulator [Fodinibius roseus]|uniref:AraC family transcriptional regulator n=1 Tax=Fodinibius roseus TaxID=1194090 RepID=A0A1M5ER46_9BACT|nr:GyrI-like domain-containing protein [Fodinibius roseus]SHF81590.1 AraC family transcriptional regulator [Fodinibius roseus]